MWVEDFACLFIFLCKAGGFSLRVYGKFSFNKNVSLLVKTFTRGKIFLGHLYYALSVPVKEKRKMLDVLWEVPEEDCIAYAKQPRKVWQQT